MKIQKHLSKRIGDKSYYKYVITIPKKVVEASKLLDKQLKTKSERERIIIEKE